LLLQARGGRYRPDSAPIDLRTEVVREVVGNRDGFVRPDRVDIERIGHWDYRRTEEVGFAFLSVAALGSEDVGTESQSVGDVDFSAGIEAVDALPRQQIGLNAIVAPVLDAGKQVGGGERTSILASGNTENPAVGSSDRPRGCEE